MKTTQCTQWGLLLYIYIYSEMDSKNVHIQRCIAISFSVELQCLFVFFFPTKLEFAEQADALNVLQNVEATGIQLV